jgi:hypothetical protein
VERSPRFYPSAQAPGVRGAPPLVAEEGSMKTILKYGLILGLLVCLWSAVVIAAGWYKDPAMLLLFFLVIPLQITILVAALRETAETGASYGKQVLNGVAVSLVGGVIIVLGSVVLTTVVFPDYFPNIKELGHTMLERSGQTAEAIEETMKANAAMYEPWPNALNGFIGTMITGVVASAIAGLFLRKK